VGAAEEEAGRLLLGLLVLMLLVLLVTRRRRLRPVRLERVLAMMMAVFVLCEEGREGGWEAREGV